MSKKKSQANQKSGATESTAAHNAAGQKANQHLGAKPVQGATSANRPQNAAKKEGADRW